jgi:hypothetical protein
MNEDHSPKPASSHLPEPQGTALRKVIARLAPGKTDYQVLHNLGTEDVIVQTRIANRIREGGIAIHDENTVRMYFGGVLNEPLDVVIIG